MVLNALTAMVFKFWDSKVLLVLSSYFIFDTSQYVLHNLGIVGGHVISIDDAPFMVSLRVNGEHVCGGSIIDEKFILTAAHCIYKDKTYEVWVGSNDIKYGGKKVKVETVYVHEGYKSFPTEYDICIIRLEKPLSFEKNKVEKVILPSDKLQVKEGTWANVTGWGRISTSGSMSQKLRQVSIPVASWKKCFSETSTTVKFTEYELCAGLPGQDMCVNDSGGPLTMNGIQIGIVSRAFSYICGEKPGIYTNVAKYRLWIDYKMHINI